MYCVTSFGPVRASPKCYILVTSFSCTANILLHVNSCIIMHTYFCEPFVHVTVVLCRARHSCVVLSVADLPSYSRPSFPSASGHSSAAAAARSPHSNSNAANGNVRTNTLVEAFDTTDVSDVSYHAPKQRSSAFCVLTIVYLMYFYVRLTITRVVKSICVAL